MRSDLELLSAHLGGDETAFRAFYERHRRQVFVYLLSVLGARDEAEDALQETFCGFLESLERDLLRRAGRQDFRPYLVRAARCRAIDELRRRRRTKRTLDAIARERPRDPFLRPRDGLPDYLSKGLAAEDLEDALGRLPAEQHEAVVLRALVGLTFGELAEVTGVPEKTAVSRFRYGIEKLRAVFAAGRDERTGP